MTRRFRTGGHTTKRKASYSHSGSDSVNSSTQSWSSESRGDYRAYKERNYVGYNQNNYGAYNQSNHRGQGGYSHRGQREQGGGNSFSYNSHQFQRRSYRPRPKPPKLVQVKPHAMIPFFENGVHEWSNKPAMHTRIESYGVSKFEAQSLLHAFATAVEKGELSDEISVKEYLLERFTQTGTTTVDVEIIYCNIFFQWLRSLSPEQISVLQTDYEVSSNAVATLCRLAEAADRRFPAEEYPMTRSMHRKVIMHVGPTNSGKTHHALRALAAAPTGVYAGPLRLLAHEIWERLNMGQIVPAGMDPEEPVPVSTPAIVPEANVDVDTALDVISPSTQSAVKRLGNPKFKRECNMLTGEESKIVADTATLLSCTVEMLSTDVEYDVAVVDEIQMISDEQRGFGWTHAVLGIRAKELHLCGEETAVPIVEALLKETGDELIVNRYQRLTPLIVEEESLNGNWSKVQKGDCIVAFSRSTIFEVKREVEEKTGMRCAVVYGKLPPEIRSEQAALFNDPDSGYDVIIGSDAIGMGLNLKIRRVIFQAVSKGSNSGSMERLSISSVKQIAGRAGRFGLHGNNEPGGFTTTFLPDDLNYVRNILALSPPSLPVARIGPSPKSFDQIIECLPAESSTETIYDAHTFAARLPISFRYANIQSVDVMSEFLDSRIRDMTSAERRMWTMAPIPWRDQQSLDVVSKMASLYRHQMRVDFNVALEGTPLQETLRDAEYFMSTGHPARDIHSMLLHLETFHKLSVLYMWMSFRNAVVYSQGAEVAALKVRVEKALEWCLERLTMNEMAKGVQKTSLRPKIEFRRRM
ncbi:P-loop containing nucleoside triphosphate hydrolase protein [Crucibulum laeve]|uniref:P-loop containing nucleoside triphosphate hydrolase protein n=1 Tax=Crucibulum laeve TaxID=68775 RepID=A0A5C3LQR0_9AGAR|nr:P-loop containing nucleoside triphosphate hydrolase protein [Crucibulum laeve]